MKFKGRSRIAAIISVAFVCAGWAGASPVSSQERISDDWGVGPKIILIQDRDYANEFKAELDGGAQMTGGSVEEQKAIDVCKRYVRRFSDREQQAADFALCVPRWLAKKK